MQSNISEVERSVRRYWYTDGIGELVGGVMLMLLGVYFALQESIQSFLGGNSLVGLILQMGVFLFLFIGGGWIGQWLVNFLKARLTYRRTGYVEYPPDRERNSKKKWILLIALSGGTAAFDKQRHQELGVMKLFRVIASLFLLSSFLLSSCSPGTPASTPQLVTVFSTFAAQPWLAPLYDCAGSSVALSRVDDPASAAIILRVGEPEFLDASAYQIDMEEILIVAHRQSPVQNLTLEEAQSLFAGQGDPSVQVWVYASGEDVQDAFDRVVMTVRSVSASARMAVNPQQMSDTLVSESNAVGILPRHWKVGDTRDVFTVATVPVLALTNSEPQGVIQELIACLQK